VQTSIITTDNGYYLGEHGLGDKRSAYEDSFRIPLMIRYPKLGLRAKTMDQIALNLDLAPTLLDFAGVPIPAQMQGRSWRPLLEGKPVEWRKSFFYEYFFERGYTTPTVLALRTDTAKLIQYPGHEEWQELFDVQSDPHEMNNLARDPAQKPFLDQMIKKFDEASANVGFVIPDFADKPGETNPRKDAKAAKAAKAAGPAGVRSINDLVLAYQFGGESGTRIADASGKNNTGTAHGTVPGDGPAGRNALHFGGKAFIEVPKSASLNCAGGPWTVEAVVKSDQPDGVILARGGKSLGYALYLEEGHPAFCVNLGSSVIKCMGGLVAAGKWTHLAGVIGADRQLRLYVDGALAATSPLGAFINRDPNDTMQIGADNASTVTEYKHGNGFVGTINQIRLFSGERSADEIREAASSVK
jgi:hypothetical protein